MIKANFFALLLFLLAGIQVSFSQSQIIRGKVIDAQTGEELIGAAVMVEGTTIGASTDLDGNYTITGVKPGTHNLICSYISYKPHTEENVVIQEGSGPTIVNLRLYPDGMDLDEFNFVAKANTKTESALLLMKKSSTNVIDGISSEQFSKTGDGNAAAALKRVTGLSVEGGKYVYVRGLSDRYSMTTLNNAEIPGLDPDRNTVQMDIFPSNIIEQLVVNKTFSPELPGSFTGGHVNIVTRDFPEKYTFQFSSSLGFNPQSHFNKDFLSYEGGKLDWLGFDDGTRSVPELAQDQIPARFYDNALLDKITKSFNKIMAPENKTSLINHSHSISLGNQVDLFRKPFGFVIALSYSHNYSYIDNGITGRYKLIDGGDQQLSGQLVINEDQKGTEEVLWAGLANFTYKFSDNHKIGILLLHNQNGEKLARYQEGIKASDEANMKYQTRTLQYLQRSLSSFQLKGSHYFDSSKLKLDWLSSFTLSLQDEPDLRFFTNSFTEAGGYEIQQSLYPVPTRYFRNMQEINIDNKIDFEKPFEVYGAKSKFKYGAGYLYKNRSFEEQKFFFTENSNSYYGDIAAYLNDSNMNADNALFVSNSISSNAKNSYDGFQHLGASYAMVDIPLFNTFKIIAGARFEYAYIYTKSRQEGSTAGILSNYDLLPALNIIYNKSDETNFRLAASRTLARPSFRELAPFASLNFIGDYVFIGNPDLQRTQIDNFDARWEHYMSPLEIVSLSGFYKIFHNPIERTFNTRAANPELTLRNVEKAQLYGFEAEFRKKLDSIAFLKNFMIGGNFTFVKSVVSIDSEELSLKREFDPDFSDTRVMFGQSPFIINAIISYKNDSIGLSANLSYNISGQKLFLVNAVGIPDVYEQARNQLDFNISKKFGNSVYLKFTVKNILNAAYLTTYNYKDIDYIYSQYNIGRIYSLSFDYKF
jgi:hypothetical protein